MESSDSMRSLSRALDILQAFNPDRSTISGAEASKITGIPRTTAYRILNHLSSKGFLLQNPQTGEYSVGPKSYTLGSLFLTSTDIVKAAEPVVKTLADITGEAVNVIIREQQNVVVIMKEESRSAVRYSHHIGSSWPAYASAVGKALLSELSDSQIDELYPEQEFTQLTPKTIKNRTELKRELEQIRRTGVAYNEGFLEGGEGIGAAIKNEKNEAVAGISITMSVFKVEKFGIGNLGKLVQSGANLISWNLGNQMLNDIPKSTVNIRIWWANLFGKDRQAMMS